MGTLSHISRFVTIEQKPGVEPPFDTEQAAATVGFAAAAVATITPLFGAPCVLAIRALDLVRLEHADTAHTSAVMHAIGASDPIAGIALMKLLLLPGKHHARDADHLRLNVKARNVCFNLFRL